jgi:hypothetical protein
VIPSYGFHLPAVYQRKWDTPVLYLVPPINASLGASAQRLGDLKYPPGQPEAPSAAAPRNAWEPALPLSVGPEAHLSMEA